MDDLGLFNSTAIHPNAQAATSGMIKFGYVGKNNTNVDIITSNPRDTIPDANCTDPLAPCCTNNKFAFKIDAPVTKKIHQLAF